MDGTMDSSSNNIQASGSSVDSFLYEFLTSAQTCTHTHTCNNPPGHGLGLGLGSDADGTTHTHTRYHAHIHLIPPLKPKRTAATGNKEVVRKYREKNKKKKTHIAYIEEEVNKLRFVNQQLIRKVQRQAVLETQLSRLRGLYLELRHKIDAELGDRGFLRSTDTVMMKMKMPYPDDVLLCCHHLYPSSAERKCIPAIAARSINSDAGVKACPETCGIESAETMVSSQSQAR